MFDYNVSIVIVNWNARELLENCLNSIYKNTRSILFEIIIVDNNSSDESCAMVKSKFNNKSNLTLIENNHNKGFAGANNQAIDIAKGEIVLLLNPDTIVNGDVIEKTYEVLKSNSKLGIVGCKVLNPDGTLQLACRRMIPTPKDAFYKLLGISRIFKGSKRAGRYNLTYVSEDEFLDVDSVSGAYLMIKREVISKIGLLDDTFFMYGEEMDWCLRAKKAGYSVKYCPVGTIIHFKGESSRQLGIKATYEFYRAMVVFYKKNSKKNHFFIVNWLVYTGVFLLGLLAIIKSLLIPNSRVGTKG